MKKLLLTSIVFGLALFLAGPVLAQENCVTVYGGGVVCGAETHEPVEAGLGDVNPIVIGAGLLLASGTLLYFSKKAKRSTQINK